MNAKDREKIEEVYGDIITETIKDNTVEEHLPGTTWPMHGTPEEHTSSPKK